MKSLISLIILFISFNLSAQSNSKLAYVRAIHDGDGAHIEYLDTTYFVSDMGNDTFSIKTIKVWVRFVGGNAPEVQSNHITANQPFGVQVTDSVRLKLKHNNVVVTFHPRVKDKYNRPLVSIYLNGTDFVEYELRNGWMMYMYPNDLSPETRLRYRKARDKAKAEKLIIFSDPSNPPIDPSVWAAQHSH